MRTVCGDGMCIVLGSACAFLFDATFFFTYQDGEDYPNVGVSARARSREACVLSFFFDLIRFFVYGDT